MRKNLDDIFNQISADSKRFEKKIGYDNKKSTKNLTMRDFVGMMRTLNEEIEALSPRQVSQAEIDREHEKFSNYFSTENVSIEFQPLEVFDDGVFFGGTIDGQILFIYRVTRDENTSGVEIKYLDGFNPRDPNDDKVVKMIQLYYKEFSEYWRKNELELNNG